MKMKSACKVVLALFAGCAIGAVSAKLPAPSEEQKAKAAETKTKADQAAKKDAELLAKSQDRAVERYEKTKGRVTKSAIAK